MSGRGNSQPEVSNDASPEWGMVPLASERASQDHLLEQGTNLLDSGSTEWGGVPGDHGQKGHQPSSEAEEKEPDRGSSQEEGAQRGLGANQEEGDSIPGSITRGPEPGSVDQGLPDLMQTLSKAGREAQGSCSSPRFSSLRTIVITDVSTDPTQLEQRALEVAGLSGKAPDGGHSWALLRGMPLYRETTAGRGEAGQEAKLCGNVLGGPAAFLALAHGIQEPIVGAGDSIPVASEMGSGVDQTQVSGADQEGLGGFCALPLLLQPLGEKAVKLGNQRYEQDLRELSLSLGASAPLVHREAVDGPPLDTRVHQGNPDALKGLAGQPKHPPDSADQDVLGESPAMELDFLPDSQIQDALEASDFEDPPKQVRVSPSYSQTIPGQVPVATSPLPNCPVGGRWGGWWSVYTAESRGLSCNFSVCGVHGFLERTDLPLYEGPVPNICMELSFSTVICRDFAYFRDLPTQQAMGKPPDKTAGRGIHLSRQVEPSFSPASRGKLRSLNGGTPEPGLSVGALGGRQLVLFPHTGFVRHLPEVTQMKEEKAGSAPRLA